VWHDAGYFREEPGAGKPPARICEGGAKWPSYSTATIDEPTVFPWMPAASVYFDDSDGHSLEYIAVLPHPPRPDIQGRVPLSVWEATNASG
jgi:hypothetical protein